MLPRSDLQRLGSRVKGTPSLGYPSPQRMTRYSSICGRQAFQEASLSYDRKSSFRLVVKAASGSNAKSVLKSKLGSRRSSFNSIQRGIIEEAKAALEAESRDIDLPALLPGTWRVLFTTALDVVPLVTGASRFGPVQAGTIWQKFSSVEEGEVTNIIEFDVLPFLEKGNKATAKVKARYEVRSDRRIALTFQAAELSNIQIGRQVESLLAPALLPRSWINHRLLMAIKEFNLSIPLSRGQNARQNFAGEYLLTYLDEDTLIGQQTGGGGYFIFEKERPEWN